MPKPFKRPFAVALNLHDHNTYDGKLHNQRERFTRFKHNLPYHAEAYAHQSDILNQEDYRLNDEFIDEYFNDPTHIMNPYSLLNKGHILAFTYTYGGIRKSKDKLLETVLKGHEEIFNFEPKKLWDYYFKDNIYYIDHHQSHATYAFLNSGYSHSDILAIDGIGSKYRCVFFDQHFNMTDLSDKLPIGWLWNHMSNLTGFGTLGASKLMGKVGYGKYSEYYYQIFETIFDGPITEKKQKHFKHIDIEKYGIDDLAYTLQKFTIDKIKKYVYPLRTCYNLCVAGGVAYNGYMNEEFLNHWNNVYVPPAVGDEGQAIGTYQHCTYTQNNEIHISKTFAGKKYELDKKIITHPKTERWHYSEIALMIANGAIVGWFQDKSESGNRALGNRSILADPRNPEIKDIINHTIKMREDFRPFAPAVLEEHYQEYFDTRCPSPYMSRICKVKPDKIDKIPGVTHIDGTARIQTVNEKFNPKFYKIINEFYKLTGVPMLLNTSFNCQEPIVETPEQAIRTFKKTALNFLVIDDWTMIK
jgi:carbamoyltransferase